MSAPDGFVISHPEAVSGVHQLDYVGSTEYIINTIKAGAPNTRWLVGTELYLVDRLAEEVKPEGKIVHSWRRPFACARRCSV